MGCTPIGPPSRSMYMLIELGRLRVLTHHLAWGGGNLLFAVTLHMLYAHLALIMTFGLKYVSSMFELF